jgi:hypothetical protein
MRAGGCPVRLCSPMEPGKGIWTRLCVGRTQQPSPETLAPKVRYQANLTIELPWMSIQDACPVQPLAG